MKPGDLVTLKNSNAQAIGIVTEVFSDLSPHEPWVRVLFTHPVETYRWVKFGNLVIIEDKKMKGDP